MAVRSSLGPLLDRNHIDPLSAELIRAIHPWARVPAFMLALTACRWSELQQSWFQDLAHSRILQVPSSKHSHPRKLGPFGSLIGSYWKPVAHTAYITVSSYDSVLRFLQKARKEAGFAPLLPHLDGSHIFRHIRASSMFERGYTINEVARWLGHKSTESTSAYVHHLSWFKQGQKGPE